MDRKRNLQEIKETLDIQGPENDGLILDLLESMNDPAKVVEIWMELHHTDKGNGGKKEKVDMTNPVDSGDNTMDDEAIALALQKQINSEIEEKDGQLARKIEQKDVQSERTIFHDRFHKRLHEQFSDYDIPKEHEIPNEQNSEVSTNLKLLHSKMRQLEFINYLLNNRIRGNGGLFHPNAPSELSYERLSQLEDVHVGLTPEHIDQLSHSFLFNGDKLEDNKCSICCDNYNPQECLRRLNCFHCFHKDCIDEWLQKNKKCPICKEDITQL